ncbi:hypothetical protein J2Z48_001169 [Croceifilum oryzae]|uniref:Uncharacterized protein n=1 Tax=Croceifilum oryzae TaxID=1553429 RepID=A0AAJ1WPZ2_9BACL|nr:hypothetical protein [Croceifilum oryzae]
MKKKEQQKQAQSSEEVSQAKIDHRDKAQVIMN